METTKLDLSTYEWPEVTGLDLAFPTAKAPADLIEEAESRSPTKGRKEFSRLFFNGGKVNLQADVKGTWKEKAWMFCRVLMGSWEPSHEDKEAVCAMIIEEVLILE